MTLDQSLTSASGFQNSHSSPYHVHLVAGSGNPVLAHRVSDILKVPLTRCSINHYPSGEIGVSIDDSVRGGDVYIVQPTCATEERDVNEVLFELMFIVRKLKLHQAARVTALVPFFAYARQDRKTDLRVPISASAVSLMMDSAGVDRVVTLDLHSGQIQGYFNNRAPLDNLQMMHEFAQYVRNTDWFTPTKTVVVSPDAGGVGRAHQLAELLEAAHVVTIMKRRVEAGKIESMQTVGDVAGFNCIIIDDMVDTGGTLVKACELLASMGAARVTACITHGIMTNPCCDRVNKCEALQEIVVSDSLPQERNIAECTKIRVLSVARLLASAIATYHGEHSVSTLFSGPSSPQPQLSALATPKKITPSSALKIAEQEVNRTPGLSLGVTPVNGPLRAGKTPEPVLMVSAGHTPKGSPSAADRPPLPPA